MRKRDQSSGNSDASLFIIRMNRASLERMTFRKGFALIDRPRLGVNLYKIGFRDALSLRDKDPVTVWRHTGESAECACEMALVAKSAVQRDLRNFHLLE